MIDTHCHLNFEAFKNDFGEAIKRFRKAQGEALICVGAKVDSSRVACEISKTYPMCFAAVGVHPHHATSIVDLEADMDKLMKLAALKRVVAIGETGLDKYQYKNYPTVTSDILKKQAELFERQIDIAIKTNLPLIIHARQAHADVIKIIKRVQAQYRLSGVFHCFDGEGVHLQEVMGLGFYVGFDGNVTYPANERLRDLIRMAPLARILTETDSPYLTPQAYRGTRNEPAYIAEVVKTIAAVKNISYEEVVAKTSANAKSLFGI